MDYACAKMFLGEGKVGCNVLYLEILTKTRSICTHRMTDDMIRRGLMWWRRCAKHNPDFGPPNIGNQDIKTFFLSFLRAPEDRKFMAYSGCHLADQTAATVQFRGHGRHYEADGPESMYVWRQDITTNSMYL